MAVEKVRHIGDLVACVCAEDEATAIGGIVIIRHQIGDMDRYLTVKKAWKMLMSLSIGEISSFTNQCPKACIPKSSAIVQWSEIHMLHRTESGR